MIIIITFSTIFITSELKQQTKLDLVLKFFIIYKFPFLFVTDLATNLINFLLILPILSLFQCHHKVFLNFTSSLPITSFPHNLPFLSKIPNNHPFLFKIPNNLPFLFKIPNNLPFLSKIPNNLPFLSKIPNNLLVFHKFTQSFNFSVTHAYNHLALKTNANNLPLYCHDAIFIFLQKFPKIFLSFTYLHYPIQYL